MSYSGYSKYLYQFFEGLQNAYNGRVGVTPVADAVEAGLQEIATMKSDSAAAVGAEEQRAVAAEATLSSSLQSESLRAAAAEDQNAVAITAEMNARIGAIATEQQDRIDAINQEVMDRNTAISNAITTTTQTMTEGMAQLQQELSNADMAAATRLTTLENWRNNNTDAISAEIDTLLNEKVTQSAYDLVVADLQSEDSAMNTTIANNLTARKNADAKHNAFMNAFFSAFNMTDSSGVILTAQDFLVEDAV